MSDVANTLADGGLPEVDSPIKKKNIKPLIFILAFLAAVVLGAQYFISSSGLFKNESTVVTPPPMPVPSDDLVSGVSLVEPVSPEVITDASGEPVASLLSGSAAENTAVSASALDLEPVLKKLAELELANRQLQQLRMADQENYKVVMSALKQISEDQRVSFSRFGQSITGINEQIKINERWLSAVSNQLQDIGVSVKTANEDFPIVVFGKTTWGTDVFLTVAMKAEPTATQLLRLGGSVGRWSLTDVSGSEAVFKHVDGNEKRVLIK